MTPEKARESAVETVRDVNRLTEGADSFMDYLAEVSEGGRRIDQARKNYRTTAQIERLSQQGD